MVGDQVAPAQLSKKPWHALDTVRNGTVDDITRAVSTAAQGGMPFTPGEPPCLRSTSVVRIAVAGLQRPNKRRDGGHRAPAARFR